MKSKEEIEARLSDCQAKYENLKEWREKVHQKYLDNKKLWESEADKGEYDFTWHLINETVKEIKILEWVLKDE
jgi:hypothetical protein